MHQRSRIRRRRRVRSGFTLMEVLLVLAILVVLASLVVMNFDSILGGVDEDSTVAQIQVFEDAIKKYKLDMRQPPQTLDDLVVEPSTATGSRSRWRGPYLEDDTIPMDAWENPYQMEEDPNTGKIVIYSYGADGQGGTDDDIRSDNN